MPYYRVTVFYHDGSSVTGIRAHLSPDIDFVARYFSTQVISKSTKRVDDVEVVMVPKTAPDVRKYISRQSTK